MASWLTVTTVVCVLVCVRGDVCAARRSRAVEAEFEAKVHHPFPTFLFVLMQKYHREYREEDTAWTPESTEPPVDSIAQFALFLSDLLVHRGSFTVREMRSMEVMLQVL